jgi:hypothetical protein
VLHRRCKERPIFALRHFAGSHGELAVLHASEPGDVSLDGDVVGWIRENQLGAIVTEQPLVGGEVKGAAAEKPMRLEEPEVAKLADRSLAWIGLCEGIDRISGRIRCRTIKQEVDFDGIEPRELHVELDVSQLLQLRAQRVDVEARQIADFVVGDREGLLLIWRQVREPHARDLFESQIERRLEPGMSGEDAVVLIDCDGAVEAETPDGAA